MKVDLLKNEVREQAQKSSGNLQWKGANSCPIWERMNY